jgi:putative ABC transport system ATP-binding protein
VSGIETGIQTKGLEKSYDDGTRNTRALRGVDLSIDPGEFVAVVGTSGSGKTTLLNIVGALDRDYTGQVSVGGRDLAPLGESEVARLRNETFGFVFQQFHLLEHLTVRENVQLPGFFGGGQAEARADTLLRQVGLGEAGSASPARLSGGQRQRVAIARALYRDPSVLLCDEPTGNLDRQTGLQVLELFRRLNREREVTVLLVTHEDHIAGMAQRIVRLEEGSIVSDKRHVPSEPEATSTVETRGAAPRAEQIPGS